MTSTDPLVIRIPDSFTREDQRAFFRYILKLIYDLRERSGGSGDSIEDIIFISGGTGGSSSSTISIVEDKVSELEASNGAIASANEATNQDVSNQSLAIQELTTFNATIANLHQRIDELEKWI